MRLAVKDESFAEVQTLRQGPAGPQDSPSVRTLRQSLPLTVQGQGAGFQEARPESDKEQGCCQEKLQEGKAGVRYSSQELRMQGCFI